MKRKDRLVLNTGTTSLIMIFAVLALVTFSLLSLSAANARWKLAEKMADRMTQYYHAECSAADICVRVEQELEAVAEGGDEDAFLREVQELSGTMEEVTWEDGLLCWQIPVSERQQLSAALRPRYESGMGGISWTLERWQITDTGQWSGQQTLELYGAGQ